MDVTVGDIGIRQEHESVRDIDVKPSERQQQIDDLEGGVRLLEDIGAVVGNRRGKARAADPICESACPGWKCDLQEATEAGEYASAVGVDAHEEEKGRPSAY